ncbi:MAG: hypothetical protein AAGF11_45670 [Myxococcota bacterium]
MTFMEVFSLVVNSYRDLQAGQTLTGTGTRWVVDNVFENRGFKAYNIRKDGGWHALVFRGTDGARDWLYNNIQNALGNTRPPQYVSGEYITSHFGAGKILVGHSLGGGIATFASAFHGVPAVTLFPAPVIPSSLPDNGARADVVNYVCHGEVLTELSSSGRTGNFWRDSVQDIIDDALSDHQHRRLGDDFWVQSNAGDPLSKHFPENIVL